MKIKTMKKLLITVVLAITFLFGTNTIYAMPQGDYNLAIIDSNISYSQLNGSNFCLISNSNLGNFSSYAVSYNTLINNYELQEKLHEKINDGIQVSIYGALTIKEYKDLLNIETFEFSTPVFNSNNNKEKVVITQFSEFQENTVEENIISYAQESNLPNLIATVENYTNEKIMLQILIEEFENNRHRLFDRALIIDSQFGFKSYLGAEGTVNVDMGYILYTDENDVDPNRDYYALTTNFTFSLGNGSKLYVKHSAANKAYNFIDYGPRSCHGTSSIGVNLGAGGVALSYTYTANGTPNITSQNDTTNKAITWTMTHVPFSLMFGTGMYSFSSSFAVPQNEKTISMDIEFNGEMSRPSSTAKTKLKTVSIRFNV
jgi:hypothetical protein